MSCQHFPLSRQPSQSKGQNLVVTALCVPCSLARVRASPAFKDFFESLPVSYAQGTRSSYPQSPVHKPRCLVNCAHGSLVCQSSALRLKALDPPASESTTIERLAHLIAAHAPLSSLGQHVAPDPPPRVLSRQHCARTTFQSTVGLAGNVPPGGRAHSLYYGLTTCTACTTPPQQRVSSVLISQPDIQRTWHTQDWQDQILVLACIQKSLTPLVLPPCLLSHRKCS